MTLTPPRLPEPGRDHLTFLRPPDPGTTAPAVGLLAIHVINSSLSDSSQYLEESLEKAGVSTAVSINQVYGKAV